VTRILVIGWKDQSSFLYNVPKDVLHLILSFLPGKANFEETPTETEQRKLFAGIYSFYKCRDKTIHKQIPKLKSLLNMPYKWNEFSYPIHYAIYLGSMELVIILHQNGADVSLVHKKIWNTCTSGSEIQMCKYN